MASKKSALLTMARAQLADDPVEELAPEPSPPSATKPNPVKRAPSVRVSVVDEEAPELKKVQRKAPREAAPSRYEELVEIGSPRAFLENHGLGGGPSVVLNVQLPAALSAALETWVAAKPGRHKKALINGLLAAYLADQGLLKLGE